MIRRSRMFALSVVLGSGCFVTGLAHAVSCKDQIAYMQKEDGEMSLKCISPTFNNALPESPMGQFAAALKGNNLVAFCKTLGISPPAPARSVDPQTLIGDACLAKATRDQQNFCLHVYQNGKWAKNIAEIKQLQAGCK